MAIYMCLLIKSTCAAWLHLGRPLHIRRLLTIVSTRPIPFLARLPDNLLRRTWMRSRPNTEAWGLSNLLTASPIVADHVDLSKAYKYPCRPSDLGIFYRARVEHCSTIVCR